VELEVVGKPEVGEWLPASRSVTDTTAVKSTGRDTPKSVADGIKHELAQLARPAGNFDAARYFRGADDLRFYNVGTPTIRALATRVHRAHKDRWTLDEALTFADLLVKDPHLEVKAAGILVLERFKRAFEPSLLSAWKRWLADGHSSNWATTDAICSYLIGPLVVKHPELAPKVAAWSRDKNMWVRRASIVGLLRPLSSGAALDTVYAVAAVLHRDQEDLIQKAVGWALRDAGKQDAARLERYLREHGPSIPRTTVRYAIERFPEAKRRALLAATKASAL
jgi:3-methyladenine DNA glycosylase AlkD